MDRTGPDADESRATGIRGIRSKWRLRRAVIRQGIAFLAAVVMLGAALYTATGVWPPMVAVKSPSMEPHLSRGDLVVVVDPGRFPADGAVQDTGVVTHRRGSATRHRSLGAPGDVIVFRPNGVTGTPVIHRAAFWVNESENWYAKADPASVDGQDCRSVPQCPAPHAGFVTKGDANRRYDQVNGISAPVRPRWTVGKATVRVPVLGYVRLIANDLGTSLNYHV